MLGLLVEAVQLVRILRLAVGIIVLLENIAQVIVAKLLVRHGRILRVVLSHQIGVVERRRRVIHSLFYLRKIGNLHVRQFLCRYMAPGSKHKAYGNEPARQAFYNISFYNICHGSMSRIIGERHFCHHRASCSKSGYGPLGRYLYAKIQNFSVSVGNLWLN